MEQSAPSSPCEGRADLVSWMERDLLFLTAQKKEGAACPVPKTPGTYAWAPMDEDSVARPEDICHLEIEWDLNVWNETQDHARTDDSGEPQKLFQDDASPSSAVEDDSA